jgi:hypothetical protein
VLKLFGCAGIGSADIAILGAMHRERMSSRRISRMLSAFDRRMYPLSYKQVENNGDGPVDAAFSEADSLSTKVVGEAV